MYASTYGSLRMSMTGKIDGLKTEKKHGFKPPMIFRVLGGRLGVWTSLSYITKLSLKKEKKMKEKKRRGGGEKSVFLQMMIALNKLPFL